MRRRKRRVGEVCGSGEAVERIRVLDRPQQAGDRKIASGVVQRGWERIDPARWTVFESQAPVRI